MSSKIAALLAAAIFASLLLYAALRPTPHALTLYNISYDPTRELYQSLNQRFIDLFHQHTGETLSIKMSNGGSGKQARTVLDGGKGDVVTLALAPDIDMLAARGHLLPSNWQSLLPDNSSPYTSTIVFLVRQGNPKHIRDWNDLLQPGVSIIAPDPRSSGGARWAYLAAWGQALLANHHDESKARAYVAAFYRHVPVLDTGARDAALTFAQRAQGDVLVSWESDAYLTQREFPDQHLEIVTPSISILAEPPVAVVQKNAQRDGVADIANQYLRFLYTPDAQEIIAEHHYRPRNPEVAKRHAHDLPPLRLFTLQELFGSWKAVQSTHFSDRGIFDQIQRTIH